MQMKKKVLSTAVAAAVASIAVPMTAAAGEYRSGDFHNHTTCSDGSTSVKVLTRQALETYGHDWFIHVGHSGSGPRDCRVSDFLYHALGGGSSVGLWTNSGVEVKGDENLRTFDADQLRWQHRRRRPLRTCGAGSLCRSSTCRASSKPVSFPGTWLMRRSPSSASNGPYRVTSTAPTR